MQLHANVDIVEGWITGAPKDKTFAPAQKNLCQSQWQPALAAQASAGRSSRRPEPVADPWLKRAFACWIGRSCLSIPSGSRVF